MTSQGCEVPGDAERILPQVVTPAGSAQSQPWRAEVRSGRLLPHNQPAARCTLILPETEPHQASQRPDIILLFKWEKSLIAMLMTFICENITNSLVYICVHL